MSDHESSVPEPVGAVPGYPDIHSYAPVFGHLQVWEGDGWMEESMAWKESCYVAANLTGPMQVRYEGPNAQKLLSMTSINDVYDWPVGTSKHLVMPDENGLVANHGLAIRDGEDSFRQQASIPWAAFQAEKLGLDVDITFDDIFILQVAGPRSIQVLERALGESLRDLRFLGVRKALIGGVEAELEVSRIGMVGTLAYELRGPYENGPAVYDAVYRAGRDLNIKRLGWRTYTVNHTEGGFPQLNCTFTSSVLANEEFMASPLGAIVNARMTGSIDPADLRARFRTPAEVNWAWMAKFDHDFLGREAVEAEAKNPRRETVILRWNKEDIADIQASMFEQGEHYKFLEFPSSPQGPLAGGHADLVTKDGKPVGVASPAIYSYYYREMICQCAIDVDQAEIGNEVILHWGDYGKRIKQVRATVSRFPYLDLPSNRDYPLETIPSGLES